MVVNTARNWNRERFRRYMRTSGKGFDAEAQRRGENACLRVSASLRQKLVSSYSPHPNEIPEDNALQGLPRGNTGIASPAPQGKTLYYGRVFVEGPGVAL